ncbi:MAG: HK97 family phage prohead protease [Candidatus Margulisiibacteriota bacterium]
MLKNRKILSVEDLSAGRSAGDVEGIMQFAIEEFKTTTNDKGIVTIEGYANTKNKLDRYGDVPTVFSALRNYVYELEEFHKNPVCLLDHWNQVGNIAGSFNPKMGGLIVEDEIGLKFKMVFSASDFPLCKHARTVYSEGHGRALSIGGRWYWEDKDHPEYLTYAKIFEISLVGVGADPDALTRKGLYLPGEAEKSTAKKLQGCLAAYEASINAGEVLSPEDEGALSEARERLNKMINKGEKTCQIMIVRQ